MGQTESYTKEGMAEMVKLCCGESATKIRSICLLKTACTADEDQTSAGVTKCTESGCTIADGTVTSEKTTVTDDTIQVVHTHTAGASATVKGAGLWNDDDDQLIAIVCYAADIALVSADTCKNTFSLQLKSA